MTKAEKISIYRSLCEQGKITALFMQPWWLDATGNWDIALGFRKGQVIGAMPYTKVSKYGIPTITMPAMTHHLQLWMDKPPDISDRKWLTREKQIIWLLIDDLPHYGYFSMVFEERSFDNWLPFHWRGFRQEMRYTYEINRANDVAYEEQINRNLKRNLKASDDQIEIKYTIDTAAFYSICSRTYKRQKMKMPYTLDLFTKLDEAITRHQAGIKLGAYNYHQELVAVAYLLWDQDRAYYFLAGDTDDGKQSGASILLCREALRIAFEERNLTTFDFCGSMIESITEIRRQFGAKPVGLMKIFKAKYKWLDVLYSLTR